MDRDGQSSHLTTDHLTPACAKRVLGKISAKQLAIPSIPAPETIKGGHDHNPPILVARSAAGILEWLLCLVVLGGAVPTTFGSSRWANAEDLQEANVIGADGIRLGSTFVREDHRAISYKGDRHLLTVAPTRSGKGTTQIIPVPFRSSWYKKQALSVLSVSNQDM
ncbi:conjugal transfer coupling protein TraG [Phaeobacter sp. CECT 5382]|uniref:type IV secretory system conjugative DNA transfer family protein n=1 Tax=Phaeobacter sp. CECT 5382 TaxID=1712645 RepID=UPI0006D985AE|nr:type IV secretory system conjugative DNA transfer family protein [Phaeobacter sp. CECT 5382]CUH87338.1 conjugal transfer coupling protein TraG [Phaeobacter sp. CECT 5382]